MQVEMSLAELLLNAIAHGDIHGVQFKRGFGNKPDDEKLCFDDLKKVIGHRLDNARNVAVESALFKLTDEHPVFRLLKERDEARKLARTAVALLKPYALEYGEPCWVPLEETIEKWGAEEGGSDGV